MSYSLSDSKSRSEDEMSGDFVDGSGNKQFTTRKSVRRQAYVHHDYFQRKLEGDLDPLPYLHSTETSSRGIRTESWGGRYLGDPATHFASSPAFADAKSEAGHSLFVELHKNRAEFNSLVTLAEGRDTVAMIGQTTSKLYSAYKSLRRGKFSDFATTLFPTDSSVVRSRLKRNWRRSRSKNRKQFAEDAWLEYHYGWVPLLIDIDDGARYLANLLHDRRQLLTVSGEGRKFFSETNDNGSVKTTSFGSVRCKYCASYEISDPALFRASSAGLTNPASVVWELIPFSFVADWFVNVGGMLELFDVEVGLTRRSCALSTRQSLYAYLQQEDARDPWGNLYYTGYSSYSTNETFTRTIEWPDYSDRFKLDLGGALNIRNLITSLALAPTVFGR